MHFVEFILRSIPILISSYAEKYFQEDATKTFQALESEFNVPVPGNYDFIVVGAGTAGCVVAARLSEKYSVLLLEAGGTPPPAAAVPFFFTNIEVEPTINYFFKSLPQTNAHLANGGMLTTIAGKMMGGSGSHNGMLHNRGSPRDFDNWANIVDDSSWNYANVLKYFKMTEDFIGVTYDPEENDDYYGIGGPIQVDTNVVPILPLWFEAGRELGYEAGDPNGFQTESFAPINKAIRYGKRSSSFTEYVEPIEHTRANLTVIRYANVSEILINDNKVAYGVAYTRHGIPQIAYAAKEIVLSGGAFQSPLLLMKSGVGPVETLSAAKIPVKLAIEAVGQNLGEHPTLILSPFHVNDSSLFDRIDPTMTEEMLREWRETGKGTLGMLKEGPQCFIASSKAESGWPDILVTFVPHVTVGSEPQIISFQIFNGRPKSRGYITLNATAYREGVRDDVQLALIDFKLLTHPEDVQVMVEGINFALRIAEETNAFRSLNMTYAGAPDKACSDYKFRSDEYWTCYLYQRTESWTHMAGTCSMGPQNGSPDTSVVDPKLRVRGLQSLRVIDASIIPAVTNANPNAAVLMIAEKGANDILNFWKN